MLAEIAAANAAFAVIKEALSHGKDIADVATTASKYFDNKSTIAKKAKADGNKSELAAFMELQKLKKQEEWIREHMIYAGDPGLWEAWLQFQADAKRAREKERREAAYQKAQDKAFLIYWAKIIGGVALMIPLITFIIMWAVA